MKFVRDGTAFRERCNVALSQLGPKLSALASIKRGRLAYTLGASHIDKHAASSFH